MTDLISFLNARLAEDVAAAQAADGTQWDQRDRMQPYVIHDVDAYKPGLGNPGRIIAAESPGTREHIVRHDPARVLREVDALRAVIQRRKALDDQIAIVARDLAQQHNLPMITTPAYALDIVLRRFVLAYERHPDFQEEWRLPSPDTW